MSAYCVRFRLIVEILLVVVSAILAVVTLIWPNWIELLFEAEPDGGDGSWEWAISAIFILAAVVFSVLARLDFRYLARNA